MPHSAQIARQNRAQRVAFGLSWWLTCKARTSKPTRRARRESTSRRTTESTPPLKPSSKRLPGVIPVLRRAATWAATAVEKLLFRFDFLELAIADQLVETRFEKLV